jgi:hypothetical protein
MILKLASHKRLIAQNDMWQIMGAVVLASGTKLRVGRSENRGLICSRDRIFYQLHLVQALSPEVKRPGLEDGHLHVAEVKNW